MFDENDAWREGWEGMRRGGLRSGARVIEVEHARAFAGWGGLPFPPLLGGGRLPIPVEGLQQREPRYIFLG